MRVAAAFRALGPIDLRAVSRDSMLVWLASLPLAMGFLMRWGLPAVTGVLQRELDFDLTPYHHLVACYFLLMAAPLMVGVVTGFLLLDERDDHTLPALLVTPLSLESYLLYRIGTPLVLCTAMSLLAMAIANLPLPPLPSLVPVVLLASLEGPILALLLPSFADSKVQGFAVMKGLGVVVMIPIFAWFIELPGQLWAGLVPSYWPLRAYWSAAEGGALYWTALAIGYASHATLLALLLRRFRHVSYS